MQAQALLLNFIQEHKFLSSLVIITLTILIRNVIFALIKKRAKTRNRDSRSAINAIRNFSNFIAFLLMIFLWSNEVQNLAVSIAAFTVAIVFATREYIQCLMGFIYISSTRAFRVGDWVQIDKHYGEVANKDWLKVTLLEIDGESYGYTGKTLTMPNNMLVSHTIKNMNFLKRYATHSFTLTLENTADIFSIKGLVIQKANQYCEHFSDVAQRYNHLIEKRLDVAIAGPDTDIRISTNDLGRLVATVTIFCPTEEAIEIEQKIVRDFLTLWRNASQKQLNNETNKPTENKQIEKEEAEALQHKSNKASSHEGAGKK